MGEAARRAAAALAKFDERRQKAEDDAPTDNAADRPQIPDKKPLEPWQVDTIQRLMSWIEAVETGHCIGFAGAIVVDNFAKVNDQHVPFAKTHICDSGPAFRPHLTNALGQLQHMLHATEFNERMQMLSQRVDPASLPKPVGA
jgi:hypothetical protein